MRNRVIISGLGIISSLGINKEENFSRLSKGESGISNFSNSKELLDYQPSKDEIMLAALINDFPFENYFSAEELEKINRPTLLILKSIDEALKDAGSLENMKDKRLALIIGSASGLRPPLNRLEKSFKAFSLGKKEFLPAPHYYASFSQEFLMETVLKTVSEKYNLNGNFFGINGICASGAISIGMGYELIKNDCADIVISCSFDFFHPRQNHVFSHFKLLTNNSTKPFDENRDGFQLGEGTGAVILQKLCGKTSIKKAYAEILGYAATNDAFHLVRFEPHGQAYSQAIELALKEANINFDQLDYLAPIGRGSIDSDLKEALGIKKLSTDNSNNIVNSLTPYLGYTLGASSIFNVIFSALQIKNEVVFPIINTQKQSQFFSLNLNLEGMKTKKINYACCLGLGFTGINTALILKNTFS